MRQYDPTGGSDDSPGEHAPAPPPGASESSTDAASEAQRPREIGGRAGPEPTRYGDWEKNGRCIDF